jgi:hypothetical protein
MALSPLEELLVSQEPALRAATSKIGAILQATVLAALALLVPLDIPLKIAALSGFLALSLSILLLARLCAATKERSRLEAELATAKNPHALQKETIGVLRYVNGGGGAVSHTKMDFLYRHLREDGLADPLRHLERLVDIGYLKKFEKDGEIHYDMDKGGRHFLSVSSML